MNLDIDSSIFIGFLVVNVAIGLFASRGIKTIKEYAVGNRNFSTATIVATLVATWISGSFFFKNATNVYTDGVFYLFAATGDIVCLLVIGWFFAPRMKEFLGKLSIAEAMGSLYGTRIRVISAISSFIGIAGYIAVQLKLAGMVFEYALGISGIYGILSAGFVIALYSSLGGIKSVTFTDVIQFFTFSIVIPMIAYILLKSTENNANILSTLSSNPLFDYKRVFDFSQAKQLSFLFLFLFLTIPSFNPATFQRIAMAKNTKQISCSFIIASTVCFLLLVTISWISILMLSLNPQLAPSDIVKHIIFDYTSEGTRGLILVGIMAMIMSTADSHINSTAVIIVHDFFKPLGINTIKNELFSTRIISLLLATFAITISLIKTDIIGLIIIAFSFYTPIVSLPFIMALLGFRSTEKSVLLGMVAGFFTVIAWNILGITAVNSVPPAMLANMVVLITSHYLLKQSGGWVGIKDQAPLIAIRMQRKAALKKFWQKIHNFNHDTMLQIFKYNCPKGEGLISVLGAFVMISSFGNVNILSGNVTAEFSPMLSYLYPLTLLASTVLISYPLWLPSWKNTNLFAISWNIIMFFVLICFNFLMVLISNFSEIQLMIFMVNIILISTLMSWRWSLFSIILGVIVTSVFYEEYLNIFNNSQEVSSMQFKIIALLLMISSILVIFLRPKQEYQQLTEEKNTHLKGRLEFQEHELHEAQNLKAEFLRNISHEYHAPMTGVMSMAEVLQEDYYKLNDGQRLKAIDTIVKSSAKLESFDTNIRILAGISKGKLELAKEEFDLSSLVYTQVERCRKLYDEKPENHEFIINIQDNIKLIGDKEHLTRAIDNLIINAIQYCKNGKIEINLKEEDGKVLFKISDEGIGIPESELRTIFDEFKVSSKTHTPAGGRGIGLTVAQKIIELHGGKITAESDGVKGATFSFAI